jgi:hypothetical protein
MYKKLFLTTILLAGFLFIKPGNVFSACGSITSHSFGTFCTIDGEQLSLDDKAICSNSSTKCCTRKDECVEPEPVEPEPVEPEPIDGSQNENVCGKLANIAFTPYCSTRNGSIFTYQACGDDKKNGSRCCNTQNACDLTAPAPAPAPDPDPNEDPDPTESSEIQKTIIDGPNNDFFDSLNPLKLEGNNTIAADLSTPGGIVSRLLLFLFPIAGLILFAMIVWGGFEILSGSVQGSKGIEAGKNRITAAIIGFLLLFATYWMAQIIEVIFGILIV